MKKLILAVVISNLLTACGDSSGDATKPVDPSIPSIPLEPSTPLFDIIDDQLCEDTFAASHTIDEQFFCSASAKEHINDASALKVNAYPSIDVCQAARTALLAEKDTYTNKQCVSGTIETLPPTEILPAKKTYQGSLLLNGTKLTGQIHCNGQELADNGHFTFKDGATRWR